MKHTDIIQTLNLEQKCALLSGETVFTTRALPGKGIPAITLSDGPNGVRKQAAPPTIWASTPAFRQPAFRPLPPLRAAGMRSWAKRGRGTGRGSAAQEVAVLLGPGLNIQRSPLCGRDFEYFSEDPILAGRMPPPMCAASRKTASLPAPSTLRSTVRSCAAWPATRCSMSAPCGSCI